MPYYGKIAQPLERIKSGKGPICWKKEQEVEVIKVRKINLSLPDYEKQFIVATDASDTGVGAVLYQKHNGRSDIIAIASKSLSTAQMRYSITKKELFAVIFALNKFNNYVFGRKFILQTDHQSLLSIFKGRRENKVISNWLHLVSVRGLKVLIGEKRFVWYMPLNREFPFWEALFEKNSILRKNL